MRSSLRALFLGMIAAVLLAPVAGASSEQNNSPQNNSPSFWVVSLRATPLSGASRSTDSAVACSVGTTADQVYTSDPDGVPDPIYVFPAGTGPIEFDNSVFDWPGGVMIRDIGIRTSGGATVTLTNLNFGDLPAGSYGIGTSATYSNVPAGVQADWADRIRNCAAVGLPQTDPPLPFSFVAPA